MRGGKGEADSLLIFWGGKPTWGYRVTIDLGIFGILEIPVAHPGSLGKPLHASNRRRQLHDWRQRGKCSKYVPPDALKMQSLALFLDFFFKHFPNYLSLHYETLFIDGFLKIHIILK